MSKPITSLDDPRYVKALGHPLRVRIFAMLSERSASPVELARTVDASLGTVAYHVRTLKDLGMVELVSERRVRGAVEHVYRAKVRPRVTDEAWGQAPSMAKQVAVDSTLQIIYDYARLSAASGGFDRAEAHLSRANMRLDERAWKDVAKAYLQLVERLQRIESSAAERIKADPHAEGISDAALVLMAFDAVRLSDQPPVPQGSGSKRRSRRPATAA
jgi:DNA-binding transcriptional ArsR family regulator